MGIQAPKEFQTNPKNVKRIMVVSLGEYFVFEHRDPRGVPLKIIERGELSRDAETYDVLELAFGNQCGAVWLAEHDPELLLVYQDDPTYTCHELSADGALAGLVAQRRGENGAGVGIPLGVYCIAVNDAWGIEGGVPRAYTVDNATRARTLAEGVALAAFTLGQQLRFSPSYTGNAMLRVELADYERRTGREIPQLAQFWREYLYERRPSPVQWRTDVSMESGHILMGDYGPDMPEAARTFEVHIYDRNMSYVSSAREVPTGNPVPTDLHMPHRPGLYLVSNLLEPEQPAVWLWEPEMRQRVKADTRGVYHILEGWYWPKGQTIDLRAWSDRIWDARRACHAVDSVAGRIAESIVKKVGVSTIGRLIQHTGRAVVSSEQARAEGLRILTHESDDTGELTGNVEAEVSIGRDDMVWPHVWGTIISNANERLWHAIATHAPHDTMLAYVDQFYCLQRHPELEGDPMQAGKFKYAGSFRVPVADLDELNTLDAQGLVKRFARYQREQGMRD